MWHYVFFWYLWLGLFEAISVTFFLFEILNFGNVIIIQAGNNAEILVTTD